MCSKADSRERQKVSRSVNVVHVRVVILQEEGHRFHQVLKCYLNIFESIHLSTLPPSIHPAIHSQRAIQSVSFAKSLPCAGLVRAPVTSLVSGHITSLQVRQTEMLWNVLPVPGSG